MNLPSRIFRRGVLLQIRKIVKIGGPLFWSPIMIPKGRKEAMCAVSISNICHPMCKVAPYAWARRQGRFSDSVPKTLLLPPNTHTNNCTVFFCLLLSTAHREAFASTHTKKKKPNSPSSSWSTLPFQYALSPLVTINWAFPNWLSRAVSNFTTFCSQWLIPPLHSPSTMLVSQPAQKHP